MERFTGRQIAVDDTPVLSVASEFVGYNEVSHRAELQEFMGIDPVQIEWCAAFVNSVLNTAGLSATESLLARSYTRWGISVAEPEPGDIMVFTRGRTAWQGHVGFYVETVRWDGVEYWVVLGGNQDQSVSYRLYPIDTPKLLAVRRAAEPEQAVTISTKNWQQPGVPLLLDSDD